MRNEKGEESHLDQDLPLHVRSMYDVRSITPYFFNNPESEERIEEERAYAPNFR